jgi:beta-phosphoglucomutase-like phosphatase (HAD superfamily)
LATSGHRRYVDLALATAGIPRVFEAEVTGELVEHGKPAPDTFLVAAELLGLPPVDCLVLEDSPNGVRSARAAGAKVFAIRHLVSEDDLYAAGADRVFSSLFDVPAALADQPWFVWASHG